MTDLPEFDELARLAQVDPEGFEALRTRLLEDAVQAAPAHCAGLGTQVLKDIEDCRNFSPDPLDAAVAAFRLTAQSFYNLQAAMRELAALTA